MQTIQLTYPHNLTVNTAPETVAAIGFFDGIHRGHQKVIGAAIDLAKQKKMKSAVISFSPHPSVVLNPNIDSVDYITPMEEKKDILEGMNVDVFYVITFNKTLSKLTPQDFIDHFIIGLNVKHLVAGFDFSYGHKGSGNVQTLKDHSRGVFDYTVLDKMTYDGEKISSTLIREKLDKGDVQDAAKLLGRYPSVRGKVIEGFKRGRTLGYPTANIQVLPETRLPAPGVYAVRVRHNDQVYNGMASLGFNPTFEGNLSNPSLEAFLFNFTGDLYHEPVELDWCAFIREEKKFDRIEDLIEEMRHDEETIKHFFEQKEEN
ncbi:Riboflavin kinase [Lentibacillus sp. JNUCC-1]|uniref:riboflavin biosynthesis protein RibF n=1 Tax=Lentibacillus sp. JNUCC-1 TaxID=2654513 RepID=UPI0012E959D7|nr:riboflavin biosynthesis protein RibF [Lentibacillus sp. JNUCC-1]MUV39916.1 Riboflavin kinase [Lentibacillus sp. JNUCC-1]